MKVKTYVEAEPTLKEVPMYTRDGVTIKLNAVLYRVSWSSGYDFNKEGKAEIEALRVFHVNNSGRTYRARCIEGCESVYKVADGCVSPSLYGKLSNAKNALRKMIQDDLKKCEKKMANVAKTMSHIKNEDVQVSWVAAKDIRTPKEVRV